MNFFINLYYVDMTKYKCKTFNELEKIYTILRQKNPKYKVNVEFNDNNKEYTIYQVKSSFKEDPDVPIDLDIKVIYGDSVTGDTPLVLRDPDDNRIYIRTIEEIFNNDNNIEYPGFKMFDKTIRLEKEYSTTRNQIWTDQGWVHINKVIRHKCEKQIYRVMTHTGCIDVTEDHSLLTNKLDPIKPNEVKIGDILSHTFPKEYNILEGFIPCYEIKSTSDLEIFLEFDSKLIAQQHFYYYRSKGCNVLLTNTDKNATKIGLYIRRCEYITYITYLDNCDKITKVINLGKTDDYVYDLETDSGRFCAGIGELQVKNTDSIFLKLKYNREDYNENRKDTFRLGTLCGELLTNEVFNRPPIEMEFEKIFQPFILLTKKRYIANKYEDIKNPMKLKGNDIKGIALTRRDYCKMVKTCYQKIVDILLDYKDTNDIKSNIDESIDEFKKTILLIDNYKVDLDDLVISGKLAKTYKNKPAHALLADKLKDRNEEVQIGDRIPYIFIEDTAGNKKKTELAEDPKYAKDNGLKYNRAAYLEQLAKPLLGLYKVVLQDYPDLLESLIDYVNKLLVNKYKGTKLKKSDFTINE